MKPTSTKGSSLVEVMIAGTIIAISASAVFPVFNQTSMSNKKTEFKDICMKMVKSKINQYKSGRYITPAMMTGASGFGQASGQISTSQNPILSMSTLNSYQPVGVADGFAFAKYVYNVRGVRAGSAGGCIADGERATYPATYPPATPANLGTEEAFGSPSWVGTFSDGAPNATNLSPFTCGGNKFLSTSTPTNTCPEDSVAFKQFGSGFRIFVHLQRISSNNAQGATAPADCPNEGFNFWNGQGVPASVINLTNSARFYNFDSVGDAVKITVTAVLASDGSKNNFQMAANDDSYKQYSCFASDVIKPNNSSAIRYTIGTYTPPYDTTDTNPNRIATTLGWPTRADCEAGGSLDGKCGTGAIMDITGRPVFTSLWNPNITGISVSPNNRAVYLLLNTGAIYRYGDETTPNQVGNTTCIGAPTHCLNTAGNPLSPVLVANVPNATGIGLQYRAVTVTDAQDQRKLAYYPLRIWTISGNANDYKYQASPQNTSDSNIFANATVNNTTPIFSGTSLSTCSVMSSQILDAGVSTGGTTTACVTAASGSPYWASRFIDPSEQPSYKILSWFLDHNGGSAFILNNTCSSTTANKYYCVSLYKWEDANQVGTVAPIAVFKRSTVAVSP